MQKSIMLNSFDCLSQKIIQEGAKGKKVYFGTGLATLTEESLRIWF